MKKSRHISAAMTATIVLISTLSPFEAFAFYGTTSIDYSGTLSGYSETWKDPWDEGQMGCSYVQSDPYIYMCTGWVYASVGTLLAAFDHANIQQQSAAGFDPWYAIASFYIPEPSPGNWTAVSNHYAEWYGVWQGCLQVAGGFIWCDGGYTGDAGWQYLGQTYDWATVPSSGGGCAAPI